MRQVVSKHTWRIFIDYGTKHEFDLTEGVSFQTKKEAEKWAKQNKFPNKCVVREEEYNSLRAAREKIVICK